MRGGRLERRYAANDTFAPLCGSIQTFVNNQVTKLRVTYTNANTAAARVNYAIFFNPR